MRGFLWIVALAVTVGAGWMLYQRGNADRRFGEVVTADGKPLVVARADAEPENPDGKSMAASGERDGDRATDRLPDMVMPGTASGAPAAPRAMAPVATPAPPAADTMPPSAANGMAFGGSGKFQWYRQGNLTWRLNTESGTTCIAFATLEEWKKPLVAEHGCRSARSA